MKQFEMMEDVIKKTVEAGGFTEENDDPIDLDDDSDEEMMNAMEDDAEDEDHQDEDFEL